jgi:diacylglycerol O-acyltransferase / wax synthase
MKPMSGLDRMLVNVESERLPMDVVGILLLDPSTAPDASHDYLRVRAELADRLSRIPVFTARFISAPLGAGFEHWIQDPDYDIDNHIKHLGAPAPGDLQSLCALAATLFDEPLDRARPLWQLYYIDGMADGSSAILLRMHHASLDGVGGMEMLTELFDFEPLPKPELPASRKVDGERIPSPVEMLIRSVPSQVMTPLRLTQKGLPLLAPLAPTLFSRVAKSLLAGGAPAAAPDPPKDPPTPRSLFNRTTETNKRSVAALSIPMTEMQTVKNHFGVTLNDVVLAITNGAVIDYLRERDQMPNGPLRVAGPVNIREEGAESASGNHFAFMMVAIPSDVIDPVARLKIVAEKTRKAKPKRTPPDAATTARKATGSTAKRVISLVDSIPDGVWWGVRELVNSTAIGPLPPVANYVVSNIPGPREPLYLAGAKVTHLYGRTMVGAGIGLFMHCISWGDSLDFGVTALADLVPDAEPIAFGIRHNLDLLMKECTSAGGR